MVVVGWLTPTTYIQLAGARSKISGYNYQKTKTELMNFRNQDPIELINKDKVAKNKPDNGVKAYYIAKYDPRMPHHHIKKHPLLANITDVCKRWASTKKACLDKDSSNTGLYKHFKTGCPADKEDGDLGHLT